MQLPAAGTSTAAPKQDEQDLKISTTTSQLASKSEILPLLTSANKPQI
jgi:hypothetical protein